MSNLAPGQEQLIRWAHGFRQNMAVLNDEARAVAENAGISGPAGSYAVAGLPETEPLSAFGGRELAHYEQAAMRLSRSLLEATVSLRAFKEQLIRQKLDCTVDLHLAPTLIAHMIVEAEEGMRQLTAPPRLTLAPPVEALHHHLVWLPDAAGHAAALGAGLDKTEQQLRLTTEGFEKVFDGMHIKALELYSMLRVAPRMVAALRRLNRDAVAQITAFRSFLAELRDHLEGCEILGTLVPLFADHMLREELYYQEKILAIDRG